MSLDYWSNFLTYLSDAVNEGIVFCDSDKCVITSKQLRAMRKKPDAHLDIKYIILPNRDAIEAFKQFFPWEVHESDLAGDVYFHCDMEEFLTMFDEITHDSQYMRDTMSAFRPRWKDIDYDYMIWYWDWNVDENDSNWHFLYKEHEKIEYLSSDLMNALSCYRQQEAARRRKEND